MGWSALLFRLAPEPLTYFLVGEFLLSEHGEAMALVDLYQDQLPWGPNPPLDWAPGGIGEQRCGASFLYCQLAWEGVCGHTCSPSRKSS